MSSHFGRRATVFCMSIWAIICVPIIVTSKHRNQMLAGRCLNSIYIGMELSVIPIFQSEIVPKQVRGLAVASYQLSFAFAGLIMSGICHRTATITNDWAWRIPFLCFLFVPAVVAIGIYFQPESPRWLVLKGRHEEARKALQAFRRADYDVEHELSQIIEAVRLDQQRREQARASRPQQQSQLRAIYEGYMACFRPRTNRRRTFIVLAVNFFQQATGQAVAGLYGPVVVKSLGTFSPFNYALILTGLTGFTYLFNLALNDHIGRRPFILTSGISQFVCLFVIAGLGTIAKRSPTEDRAMLAFIILFAVAYCIGFAPLSYVISAETPSQALRDMTTRLGFIVAIAINFVVVFTLPYLMFAPYAELGMKVAFIFAPIAVIATLWAYFCLPECKNLTLEQLDLLFEQRISARHSTAWGRSHRNQSIASDANDEITGEQDKQPAGQSPAPSLSKGSSSSEPRSALSPDEEKKQAGGIHKAGNELDMAELGKHEQM